MSDTVTVAAFPLMAKIAKATQALTDAPRDADNPYFKSRYTTLHTLRAHVVPVLTAHGLSYIQEIHADGEGASIETILICDQTGDWRGCGRCPVLCSTKDPQKLGSAITYSRRYSLAAALGISSSDDDDGNAAAPHALSPPANPPLPAQPIPLARNAGASQGMMPEDSLQELLELAAKVYLGDWQQRLQALTSSVTQGRTNKFRELNETEKDVLIGGIRQKLGTMQ